MHSLWKFRSFPWHLYFLDKTLLFFFLFVTNFFSFQTVFSHLCWQASSASLFLRYSWEWIYLLGLLSSFNHVKCISFIFSLAFCYSCYLAPWHTYKTLYTLLIIIYLLLILHSFQSLFFFFIYHWSILHCAQNFHIPSNTVSLKLLLSSYAKQKILPSHQK